MLASPNCDEHALNFAEQVKQIIKDKDLGSLIAKIDGELEIGPRVKAMQKLQFDDLFSLSWQQAIIESPSPCQKFSYSQPFYMLGNGNIWFRESEDGFSIFTMNNTNTIPSHISHLQELPIAWKYNKQTLPASCFVYEHFSSDNYKSILHHYGISSLTHFRTSPGLYLGKEISSLNSIQEYGYNYIIVGELQKCFLGKIFNSIEFDQPIQQDTKEDKTTRLITTSVIQEQDDMLFPPTSYRLIKPVSQKTCETLAPHLIDTCHSAYFLTIIEESSGSIGANIQHTIYGLFQPKNTPPYLAPLKSFHSVNEGLNFLDTQ